MAKGKRKRKPRKRMDSRRIRMGSLRQITASVFESSDLDALEARDELGAAVVAELERHVRERLDEMTANGLLMSTREGWSPAPGVGPDELGMHLEQIRDSGPTLERGLSARIAALREREEQTGEELELTWAELARRLRGMLLVDSRSSERERRTLEEVFAEDDGGAALGLLRVIQPELGLRENDGDEPPAFLVGWRKLDGQGWRWFADNVLPVIRSIDSDVLGLLAEAILVHAQDEGVMRDVSMVVSGDTGVAELVGLLTDAETGKIIGATPGTPASKLTLQEAAELSGLEVEPGTRFDPERHRITPGADMEDSTILDLLAAAPKVDDEEAKLAAWIRSWPEGEERGTLLYMGDPGLAISYVGLSNLVAQGVAARWPARMTVDGLQLTVMPNAMHRVRAAWRCRTDDQTFVRLALLVTLRTGGTVEMLQDVHPATWEALRGEGPHVPANLAIHGDVENWGTTAFAPDDFTVLPDDAFEAQRDRPVWAGARAFDKVWDTLTSLSEISQLGIQQGIDPIKLGMREYTELPEGERRELMSRYRGYMAFAWSGLTALRLSTELLVDPDQIMAMPDFDTWDGAVNYARMLHLPFDQVFLDLEGQARAPVIVETSHPKVVIVVRGAQVSLAVPGEPESGLTVMPYGCVTTRDQIDHMRTYNPLGLFMFGGEEPRAEGQWQVTSSLNSGLVHTHLAVDPATLLTDGPSWRFTSMTPPEGSSRSVAYTVLDAAEEFLPVNTTALATEAGGLTAAALVALKALFLLDMSNVEVVVAPVSRQVRRAAERREQRIALSVHVHTSSKRYTNSNASGEHLEYSHRFRVRGHVKHYPIGTRMADARPDKCAPCPRCGTCRRIWTPPFVKGPEDKPLVLKSLVLDRDPEPVDDE